MTKDELEILNQLFKTIFRFGWKVGACWNPTKYVELCEINGYFKDDLQQEKEIRNNINKLLELLKEDPQNFVIYNKEDYGARSCEWEYIAPLIELKDQAVNRPITETEVLNHE